MRNPLLSTTLFIGLLIIASIAVAAEDLASDLMYYPYFFKDGQQMEVEIVVGEHAPPQDVIAASKIAVGLQQAAPNHPLRSAKLDSEFSSITGKNIIAVGNSCENYATALAIGTSKCEAYFKEGEAYIEIHDTGDGGTAIIVAGLDPADTDKAAVVLRQSSQYDLLGRAYIVTGESAPYTVTPRSLPQVAEEDKVLERPKARVLEEPDPDPEPQSENTTAPLDQGVSDEPEPEPTPEPAPAPQDAPVDASADAGGIPAWIWIVIVLLIIVVGLVLFFVLRKGGSGPNKPITTAGVQSRTVSATQQPPPQRPPEQAPQQPTDPDEPPSPGGKP